MAEQEAGGAGNTIPEGSGDAGAGAGDGGDAAGAGNVGDGDSGGDEGSSGDGEGGDGGTGDSILGDADDGGDAGSDDGAGDGDGDGEDKGDGDEKSDGDAAYGDFQLPEGLESNAELTEEFTALAQADGLSQERAQEYVNIGARIAQEAQKQAAADITEAWQKQRAEWQETINADPDIGGDKLKASTADARLAVQELGFTEADRKFLKDTGLGNWPPLVKHFSKLGALMREDKRHGGGPGQGSNEQKVLASLYPTMVEDS